MKLTSAGRLKAFGPAHLFFRLVLHSALTTWPHPCFFCSLQSKACSPRQRKLKLVRKELGVHLFHVIASTSFLVSVYGSNSALFLLIPVFCKKYRILSDSPKPGEPKAGCLQLSLCLLHLLPLPPSGVTPSGVMSLQVFYPTFGNPA